MLLLDGKCELTMSHGSLQRVYHASGSDSGNGSGDSALSSAAGDAVDAGQHQRGSGVVIKNPRYCGMASSESSTTLKNFDLDYTELEEQISRMPTALGAEPASSRFDLENCQTLLLPLCENKPLDGQALKGVKLILKESGSRILANHLTKSDLELVYGAKDNNNKSANCAGNGLELCTLPYGHQFRMDLIERFANTYFSLN